jgi:hypothetical protein
MPEVVPQPVCPICTGRGRAKAVLVKIGERRVTYQCENCREKWEIADVMPPPSWLPRSFAETKVQFGYFMKP